MPVRLPHHFEEVCVHAKIVGEFGMERRTEHVALAHHHAMPVALGKHLDLRPRAFDPRCPNEDRAETARAREPESASRFPPIRFAGRTRCAGRVMSMRSSVGCSSPATSCAATIMPMHVPHSGMPARTRSTIGAARSKRSSSFITVVDSPPGTISPSTAARPRRRLYRQRRRTRTLERRDVFDHVALQCEDADERTCHRRVSDS